LSWTGRTSGPPGRDVGKAARRKAALAKLLSRSRGGIQIVEHIEAADGTTVSEHACKLGSRAWLKIKYPASAAMRRCSGCGKIDCDSACDWCAVGGSSFYPY